MHDNEMISQRSPQRNDDLLNGELFRVSKIELRSVSEASCELTLEPGLYDMRIIRTWYIRI